MSKAKFEAAKELIAEKRYEEARALLQTINHPTAKKWLDKIDLVAPPAKSKKQTTSSLLIFATAAVAAVVIVVVAVVLLLQNPQSPPAGGSEQGTLPTSQTFTPTVEIVQVVTSSPTWTPTATETQTPSPTPIPPTETAIPTSTTPPEPTRVPCPAQEWRDENRTVINDFQTNLLTSQQISSSELGPYITSLTVLRDQFESRVTDTCLRHVKITIRQAMDMGIEALEGSLNGTLDPNQTRTKIGNAFSGFERGRTQLEDLGVDFSDAVAIEPLPTFTPIPIPTRTPIPPQVASIGPIYDSLYDETYAVEVLLQSVQFTRGEGFEQADSGKIYVIVNVLVRNIGPGALRSLSNYSFQVKDEGGAIRNPTVVLFQDCDFDLVDLTAGGNVSGCIVFEVPSEGTLELIYAPFRYDGLQPGRYISFILR